MKPIRWSSLLLIPNIIMSCLGMMLIISRMPVDSISVGWIMVVTAFTNALYFTFRK